MKEFQMRQLKDSWAESAARKMAEKTSSQTPDFDIDRAGPASLQNMKGEDTERLDRIRKQREDMRQWIQQQIAEKEYTKQLDMEDDLNYGDMLKAIDEIREATEKEEQEMRKYVIRTVKEDNLEVNIFVFYYIIYIMLINFILLCTLYTIYILFINCFFYYLFIF